MHMYSEFSLNYQTKKKYMSLLLKSLNKGLIYRNTAAIIHNKRFLTNFTRKTVILLL